MTALPPKLLPLALLAMAATLCTASLAGERLLRHRGDGQASVVRVAPGEPGDGAGLVHGRRTQVDDAGNVTTARGTALRGPEGGRAVRGARVTHNADGSATRDRGMAASGAAGDVKSQAHVERGADGSVNGQRSTEATGAQGNTYQGNTSYTRGEGVSHTANCSDAAGNAIPCKR